jgi:hypothetical protein
MVCMQMHANTGSDISRKRNYLASAITAKNMPLDQNLVKKAP